MTNRFFRAAVIASMLLVVVTGTALAANPNGGSNQFGSGSEGGVSIQAFVCQGHVFTIKLNAGTVGSRGDQTCSGTDAAQSIDPWLEWCDLSAFGVCFHWAIIREYSACARLGPGFLRCPADGTSIPASPGAAKYRTGLQSVVQDISGASNTVSAWGPEVIRTQ